MLSYRTIVALLLALTMSLGMWSTALAYAQLVSSDPRHGAQFDRPPARFILVFSESLHGEQSSFTVMDARGHVHGLGQIDLGDLDRKTLSGKLDEHADNGLYTVSWSVVTPKDDVQTSGTISFTVHSDAAQSAADDQTRTATHSVVTTEATMAIVALLALLVWRAVIVLRRTLR